MKRNQFVSLMGLETLLVGLFIRSQFYTIIKDDQNNHMIHMIFMMDQQPFAFCMILIGLFAFVMGIITPPEHWTMTLYLSLLSGIWLAYATSFFLMDCHFDQGIKLKTILALGVAVQIMAESYFSARNNSNIRLNIVLKKKPPKKTKGNNT